MRTLLAATAAIALSSAALAQPSTEPDAVVQRQLEAYNAHDIDAFVATYAEDVELWQLGPESRLLARGREALRREYAEFFAQARPHAEITQRQSTGPYIVDRERVTTGTGEYVEASATYLVEAGLIRRVWFAPAPARAGNDARPLALTGGTLIDGSARPAIADSVVIIASGQIQCAGDRARCPVPAGAEQVDVTGRFITPGLVDTHIHTGQTGWVDGRPDGLVTNNVYPYAEVAAALRADPGRWHRAQLCSGVTAAFDVGGQPWTVAEAQRVRGRPTRLNLRAAGPLVTPAPQAALNLPGEPTFLPLASLEDARRSVEQARTSGADAVKLWFIAPAPAQREAVDSYVREIGRAARAAGLPLIVHATELREAKVAIRAGATMLVHSVTDGPVDEEFLQLLVSRQVAYAPTLVVGRNWLRALTSVVYETAPTIQDPNGCVDEALRARIADAARLRADLPPQLTGDALLNAVRSGGAEDAVAVENLRRVRRAGGRIVLGTDAGNPLTLHGASVHAELEAMESAGIPAEELIGIATRNGAAALNDAARYGTIEAGKQADLIVLTEDPRRAARAFRSISHVMRGGVLYDQSELRVAAARR